MFTQSLTRTASWVVVERESRQPVLETFYPEVVAKLNKERYEAVPILAYLQSLNRRPQ